MSKILHCSSLLAVSLSLIVASPFVARADGVTASDLCKLYSSTSPKSAQVWPAKSGKYAAMIRTDCESDQGKMLREKNNLPVYNFRPVFGEGESASGHMLFRGGQPIGSAADDTNFAGEEESKKGFNLQLLQKELGKGGVVVSLRFDRHYQPWSKVYGKGMASLPLSSGEAPYRYAAEKKLIENLGLRSLYMPTVPEMEAFVGNYVPQLDHGPGSKPYFCRFPGKFPDGAKLHWINDSMEYTAHAKSWAQKGIEGPLVSADPECRDLIPIYGKAKVHAWLKRVRDTVHRSDAIYWNTAQKIDRLARAGKKVMFHCSSGTDRAGLIAMILEAKHYGLTAQEINVYKGPDSDPKIDLLALHYLMSQWAGNSPQFSYLFPAGGRPGLITRAIR